MARSSLCLVTLALISGCSQSAPSGNLATPLAASPATATEKPEPAAESLDQTTSRSTAPSPAPRAAAKPVIAGVPPVLLTPTETGLCKLGVGDMLPDVELPKKGGGDGKLAELIGERATVILFWTPDAWMARTALTDLQREVADHAQTKGVTVVGVIVGGLANDVQAHLSESGARFTQLIDLDGKTLAECGSPALPRIYVLAPDKTIAWYDIEYSETTRRELQATLAALAPADS
jgi:peroxiredoxin